MDKIKFLTDSASDIPDEDLVRLNIKMLSVPIAVDGVGYFERESFGFEDYYEKLNEAKEIPKTSKITIPIYTEYFERYERKGYDHLVVVTINSTGSGTYESALLARNQFYEDHPELEGKYNIHVVDSRSYSLGYGYAVMKGAELAQEGKDINEILAFLDDWFKSAEVYLGCYTLKYAQKSGRINAVTAFAGEVLGMRPIVQMIDGETNVFSRVRGNKNIGNGLLAHYEKENKGEDNPILIVVGRNYQDAVDLQKLFKKKLKITPPIYKAGASIVTNSGPDILAIVYKGSKRD